MSNDGLLITTAVACRVAGLDRQRFNEFVAAGHYPCAPTTSPGRTRYFDEHDMVGLRLFRDLLDDGFGAARAGKIACAVMAAAREHPKERAISYVEDYFNGRGSAWPAKDVPDSSKWDDVLFSGTDIRKVTTFRVGKMREMNAQYIKDEQRRFGEAD